MGFPKLKNFLKTMEEKIELEEYSKNHIKIKLKENKSPLPKNIQMHRRGSKFCNL